MAVALLALEPRAAFKSHMDIGRNYNCHLVLRERSRLGFDDGDDCFRYSKLLYSTLSISFVSRVLLLSGFFFAVQSTQLLCSTLPHLFVFLIHLLSNLFRILFLHLLDLQPCWLNLYFNWLLG